jgi:hypothetical protein
MDGVSERSPGRTMLELGAAITRSTQPNRSAGTYMTAA